MSRGSRRAAAVSGWLAAAAIAVAHVAGKYDVSIQERAIGSESPAVAATMNPAPGGTDPVAAGLLEVSVAEAQAASDPELLAVDRRLAAAEQEVPSDYRFTYERAKLAVYGRVKHHEAFHHLKRAADKAIRTERAAEMLDRLEADGAPHGPLRKLAVGHREWAMLREALEDRDGHGLWQENDSARHHAAPRTETVATAWEPLGEDPHSIRMTAFSLLESGKPCQALVALRPVRDHPEAEELYHSARERCLR